MIRGATTWSRSASCVVLLLLALPLRGGAAAPPVVLEDGGGEYRLGPHLDLLRDPGGGATLDDVRSAARAGSFAPSDAEVPNLGLTDAAYWVRFRLDDRTTAPTEWLLEVAWPVVDRVTAFLPDGSGGYVEKRAGDLLPFEDWEIPYRNPTFRLPAVPAAVGRDTQTSLRGVSVYLRFEGEDTMLLPLRLWSAQAFEEHRRSESFIYGFYYGVLAILIAYNLVLFFTLRDRSYLAYVLLISAWGLYHASLNGFVTQYVWPHSPALARWSVHIAASLAFTFSAIFARSFLITRSYAPLLDRCLLAFTWIGVVFLFWPFFGTIRSFIPIAGGIGLTGSTLLLVAGYRSWRAGYRPARYYLLTWTVGITALFVWALRGYGLVPSNVFTDSAFELVVLSTAVTLSLGLADKVNVLRTDLEASVREQGRLLDELQTLNRDLERRIGERTADLARRGEELGEKTRLLEIADRHKSEFLANMSHELRTPLNAIIGFSELLLARMYGDLNDRQAGYVDDIHDSGRHLLSLINDILDLSKIEAGRMELELAAFDLPAAVENALTLVRERASRHGIELRAALADDVGEVVADERKVKQVLVNLLSNAVKFTPEGGSIEVRAERVGDALEVAVCDTGIGIAADDQDVIFDEFRQVRDAAQQTEGTGLGLSLARRLVELHGGRIWVTSEPGRGSTFTFRVPGASWPAS